MAEYQALELRRVLIADPQTDETVRLLALELYEDAVGLRYVLPSGIQSPDSPEDTPLAHHQSFSLQDDRGTAYRLHGGGASGHPVGHGLSFYTPGVPDDARQLTVTTRAGVVTFEL